MTCVHCVLDAVTPPGRDWLTEDERRILAGLDFPRRRDDWRLGRWTAKQAVMACLAEDGHSLPPAAVGIVAGHDGAPHPTGVPGPVTVSISHRQGRAFCVAARGAFSLGCDLEHIEHRSDAFVRDYFTAREAARVLADPDRDLAANLTWAAKEAALKALREGLRMDTRRVEVELETKGSVTVVVELPEAPGQGRDGPAGDRPDTDGPEPRPRRFQGVWQRRDDDLLVVVADRPFALVEHEAMSTA